jgi:glycosyltransferase involved in cell wall biosynthesis
MPTISVVIATWNRSAALERAVRSALSQSHPPLEVLVCDDGSTDDTEQVVRSMGDSRVLWLPGERAGRPAVPRNRGIRNSRGEWLAFLDDDDVWLPEKLEMQLLEAKRRRCLAVCSDAWRIAPGAVSHAKPLIGGQTRRFTFNDMLSANQVICSSMMLKREVATATAGFPELRELAAIEDYALWLRVADITDIAYLASPLLCYADDPDAGIRRDRMPVFLQRQLVMNSFLAWKGVSGLWGSVNNWKVGAHLILERIAEFRAWRK